MRTLLGPLDPIDARLTQWMAHYGVATLRVTLGVVFFWFGILKFFPGLSPARTLAVKTIDVLTLGHLPAGASLVLLATLECAIGLGLISGKFMRLTLLLLAFQMIGAASPLLLFPGEVFTQFPYAPTLEGQYIIKNLVLVSAGVVIGLLSATASSPHALPPLDRRHRPRPDTRPPCCAGPSAAAKGEGSWQT